MIYPPALMDPLALLLLAGIVLLWLYCVQHADRRLKVSPLAKPWINLAVVLGGPPAWALVMFTRKGLEAQGHLTGRLATVAGWLGLNTAADLADGEEISVELLRSDGKPLSGRFGTPVKQAEAMKVARRIVHRALRLRASDVLLDPKAADACEIRYRVDGLLRKPEALDPDLSAAVLNCFKILAEMDIAERRRPQDGAFLVRQNDSEYKCRVATSGTVYGEKMAIRVLNAMTELLPLEDLGLPAVFFQRMRRFLARSNGMMVVCGPTGSGKSTTLYAALGALAQGGRNIVTIEDPVEYTLPYASQTGINPKAGINFATQLRHVLRQAPDVILVGEIRDAETARMALQASETGHLVFSTLHANDAISGLIRLVDLGVEPFLVGAGLSCVLSQRLVRVLCESCRRRVRISPRLAAAAVNRGLDTDDIHEADGCPECGQTGYYGRVGIFQMLDMSKELAEALNQRPSYAALEAIARGQGLTALRQDGIAKVLDGRTSVDELLRVTVN